MYSVPSSPTSIGRVDWTPGAATMFSRPWFEPSIVSSHASDDVSTHSVSLPARVASARTFQPVVPVMRWNSGLSPTDGGVQYASPASVPAHTLPSRSVTSADTRLLGSDGTLSVFQLTGDAAGVATYSSTRLTVFSSGH